MNRQNRITIISVDPSFDLGSWAPTDPEAPHEVPVVGSRPESLFKRMFRPAKGMGLGDWVEIWAKPIGCMIDRCTAGLPVWLVAPKPFKGIRLSRPTPKPKRWSLPWLAAFLALATRNWPSWLTKRRQLPPTLRTGFCKGSCGCNKRRRFLNQLLPEMRSAGPWMTLCRHPARTFQAAFRDVYRAQV